MNKKTKETLFSSGKDNWETPPDFYNKLNQMFGPFTLDPCAEPSTAKCDLFYTEEDDGLSKSWKGHRVFINPPYSRGLQKKFIEKAFTESRDCDTMIVMLLPARSSTKAFHEFIMKSSAIYFVKGRIKFWDKGKPGKHAAPFPSMVVVFSSLCEDEEFYPPKMDTMER